MSHVAHPTPNLVDDTRAEREPSHILVADDSAALTNAICVALKTEWPQLRITTVHNGISALEAIQKARPPFDLVLLDMLMPGRGGLETLRLARIERPFLPIVVMTGAFGAVTGESPSLSAARRMGASGTLIKPFAEGELTRVVRNSLSGADVS